MNATFKSLTKKEKAHLKQEEITTLRRFREVAAFQAEMRTSHKTEPCFHCKSIAVKLGLPV